MHNNRYLIHLLFIYYVESTSDFFFESIIIQEGMINKENTYKKYIEFYFFQTRM